LPFQTVPSMKTETGAPTTLAVRRDAEFEVNTTNFNAFTARMYDVAYSGLDRAKTAAQIVQTASTAIATIYAALLGIVFSTSGTQLPLRGVIAPIFLGLAVVLSTYYVAWIQPSRKQITGLQLGGGWETEGLARVQFFTSYVNHSIARRSIAQRMSIIALGVGLVTLALPFITLRTNARASTGRGSFPTPDLSIAHDFALLKYKAELAIMQRTNSPTPTAIDSLAFTLWVVGIGLAVVVLVPLAAVVVSSLRQKNSLQRQDAAASGDSN
jgi:hypothetical protein